jgi:hypothetical protein
MESEDLKELQQTVLQRLNGLIQEKDYGFNQEKKG